MATLHITEVYCIRKQDVTGRFDEPRLMINNAVVWNGAIEKDQRKAVEVRRDIQDSLVLALDEMNGNDAKSLGSVTIRREFPSSPAVFKTSGTHYEVKYHIDG